MDRRVEHLESIIDFLPDATFAIDGDKRVIAWNRACEAMTGVKKASLLGKGDYAYSEPFLGERRPILVDLLDAPSPDLESAYKHFRRQNDMVFAEFFVPTMRGGQGAYLVAQAVPLYDENNRRCGAVEIIRDTTEQKRMEHALRESEIKHRTLFETAGDAILIMRHTHFTDCNARTLTMFGYTREQIIGETPFKLSPPVQPDGRPSDEKAQEKITLALTEGPQYFEWTHCRSDGTSFAADVSLKRMDLGDEVLLQVMVRDITERKRIEEALLASEKEYRELLMLANSIILRWSRDGRITFLNEFGRRFFGYSNDEIIGRHVLGTIVPDNESTGRNLKSLMEEVCADPKKFERNTNENMRRNGARVWIDWTNKVVVDERGQIREILSIGSDITERKQAEEALERYRDHLEEQVKERTRELAAAKERAESADRLKSAFLAAMSHELRTPLNSVIGFTGILLQQIPGKLNEEQLKQLGMVQNSARHLLALINDILDISKIEAGQLTIEKASFNVRKSAETMIDSVRHLAQGKGLSLITDISSELKEIIGDRRRYEQVLLNLLSNAIKFTNTGTVSISVRPTEDEMVESVVNDTGIGISPMEQEAIFKPFHQVENGISRSHEGSGLGLSISHRLAGMMGGRIWLTSELGKGSTFGFTVPIGYVNKTKR